MVIWHGKQAMSCNTTNYMTIIYKYYAHSPSIHNLIRSQEKVKLEIKKHNA